MCVGGQFFHGACDVTWPFHVPKVLAGSVCYARYAFDVNVAIDAAPDRNG